MPLYVESIVPTVTEKERSAKLLGRELVLIEVVAHLSHMAHERRHWLLEGGKKPPLDLVIHHRHGRFLELSFFISDEQVPLVDKRMTNISAVGEPVFNTQAWDAIGGYDHYLSENGQFDMALAEGSFEITLIKAPAVRIVDSGAIRFWIGDQDRLVGLSLPSIDEPLLDVLQNAGVLAN